MSAANHGEKDAENGWDVKKSDREDDYSFTRHRVEKLGYKSSSGSRIRSFDACMYSLSKNHGASRCSGTLSQVAVPLVGCLTLR